MQRAIKKEAGDNYLKRIVVAFLAVIMMTTMLRPQIVQAASAGITIESKDNKRYRLTRPEKRRPGHLP